MYIKLIFKQTTNTEILMYLYAYSTRLRFGITYTHPIRTDTHT